MVRRQIYLTELQTKSLSKEAKALGISTSEMIRRVLDAHVLNSVNRARTPPVSPKPV